MKNLFLIFWIAYVFNGFGQIQASLTSISNGNCIDVYDGVVSYSISGAAPPFYGIITNTAGCTVANPTVNSSGSTITFTGIPGCTSFYYFNFYDSGNNLITTTQTSFGVYSTSPLTVAVSGMTAATCPTCCTGLANFSYSGGSTNMGPVNFYLDNVYLAGNFYPAYNICPGTHTLCGYDNVQCKKCITFTLPGNATSILEYSNGKEILRIYPNPVNGYFKLEV